LAAKNLNLCLLTPRRYIGGAELQLQSLLTSAPDGAKWPKSRRGSFYPRERNPGTNWKEDWVDPRAVLDFLRREKFNAPAGNETPVHPLRSLIKISFFHYTRVQLLALWASDPYAVYPHPPVIW